MNGKRKVALVLSSGGARGFAHIGAIEELLEQGFEISSIAGTSMGALIGGMFAAGKLKEVAEWMFSLDRKKIFSLLDVSLSLTHVVKGDRVIHALSEIVPDRKIESLPIPYCAVAADLRQSREVVFDRGSLYAAIRSSISVPSFLKPLQTKTMTLVDGGVVNPLPLNRVQRTPGDLLVAVNVSGHNSADWDMLRRSLAQRRAHPLWKNIRNALPARIFDDNYYSLLIRTFCLMIQQNAALSLRLTPPDILVNIPMNRFGGFDYDRAEHIARAGRVKMREALRNYFSQPILSATADN